MRAAALAAVAALAAIPPAPSRWVEDRVGFLTPAAKDALDLRLEHYEQATRHQVIVWIGDTIGGADLADWAVRTFAAWKVGRAGVDDGLVVFVLADDRAVDIEVGYGLEDRVPDAIASRVIREVMTPRLQAGDRDGAITAGVDALLAAIEGQAWQDTGPPPQVRPAAPSTLELVLGGIAMLALIVFLVTHPRIALLVLSGVFRGWGGGGGFGGGGFGGGGGRSGGGGARGHW